MSDTPALTLEEIAKSYGGGDVLAGINLAIPRGQFVALVGESGSGKTTLLKTINRLVEPDGGRILIDGADAAALPAPLLRRRIGYVFQQTGLFPHLSVAENIAMPLRLAGAVGAARHARALDLLDLVGLSRDFAMRMPSALSGGQAQRVGVARALAAEPALMLMDEPFGALDPMTRDRIGTAYRALHERLGLTTVMVTHDMAEALLLADRIIVLQAGRIAADASPRDLLFNNQPAEIRALLEIPLRQAERLVALGQPAP